MLSLTPYAYPPINYSLGGAAETQQVSPFQITSTTGFDLSLCGDLEYKGFVDVAELPNTMFYPGITFEPTTLEFRVETSYQNLIGTHDYYITATFADFGSSSPVFRQPVDGVLTIDGDSCTSLILFEAPYTNAMATYSYSGQIVF